MQVKSSPYELVFGDIIGLLAPNIIYEHISRLYQMHLLELINFVGCVEENNFK